MLAAVERMITALDFVVQDTPIGTNISLLRLLWAMVNGSFLQSRGAVHGALSASNFSDEEIRRGWSALRYGAWTSAGLLSAWHIKVAADICDRLSKTKGCQLGKGERSKSGILSRRRLTTPKS